MPFRSMKEFLCPEKSFISPWLDIYWLSKLLSFNFGLAYMYYLTPNSNVPQSGLVLLLTSLSVFVNNMSLMYVLIWQLYNCISSVKIDAKLKLLLWVNLLRSLQWFSEIRFLCCVEQWSNFDFFCRLPSLRPVSTRCEPPFYLSAEGDSWTNK